MTRAVLSLGSNLGDPEAELRAGVDSFGSAVVAVSGMYATPPWGPVEQDDFFNLTMIVDDDSLDAADWLRACQAAEIAAHRERRLRWGPRTLDVDVISVWADGVPVISDDPQLTLPHPRAAERAFVLLPWVEIEPAAELPGCGPIVELLARLDTSEIRRLADDR
jgi:2-amino-4-hydroxy-6-hydroxymethyldihydropteridine diphosphokinase